MGRIRILLDYSPDFYWLAATLHKNRKRLAAANISFGPFNPWHIQPVPTHLYLWPAGPGKDPVPAYLRSYLDQIGTDLEAGRDVLLFADAARPEKRQAFQRMLDERLSQYGVDAMLVFGRPSLILEQCYRSSFAPLPETSGASLTELYSSLDDLLAQQGSAWGSENVHFLVNSSETARARFNPDLTRAIFAWLGVEAEPAAMPGHILAYGSQTARRLNAAREIRLNAWPSLDNDGYTTTLAALDQQWGEDYITPLALRQAFAEKSLDSVQRLEEMLKLAPDSLAPTEEFLTAPEVAPDAPLDEERLRQFADALDQDLRVPLQTRFRNDAHLLTGDQTGLARALQEDFDSLVAGEEQPLLTVLTMTYNHEKYIGDCIESVLAQKTDFPIRHIVLDHCSTDGTADIVRRYASEHPSIRPVLLSGRWHPENVTGLFLRCRSEYVALCDGDDYFTGPLKLQKQMDFLRANRDCSICFHPVLVKFEAGEREDFVYPPPDALPRGVRKKYYLADLMTYNFIQTNSAVYRWRFRDGLPDWFDATLCPGDWYWHLLHAEKGNIGFIPEVMSVYRRHSAACYNHAFLDAVAHRRATGMAELNVYDIVNRHFQGRYQQKLKRLAASVFDAYMQIYVTEGSSALLDEACEKFPEFGAWYLSRIKTDLAGKKQA